MMSTQSINNTRDRDQRRGCFVKTKFPGIAVQSLDELPDEHTCGICTLTKPIAEMVVQHRKDRGAQYYVRPRCKDCHNKKERGHRRAWKRNYLRKWRERNKALNDSYWKDNPIARERGRVNMARRLSNPETHEAVLIQGRLRRSLDLRVNFEEAKRLLKRFGRCYPTRFGLTPAGLKECERIRSRLRRAPKGGKLKLRPVEIRLMVYEDGMFIKPSRQPIPYQHSAETLRRYQAQKKEQTKCQQKTITNSKRPRSVTRVDC